ncbi:MAG: GTPase HflX [Cyclobacteriaceae bacterium]|nr:GTPase HflX [Cyclobacteriaceae bacterium]
MEKKGKEVVLVGVQKKFETDETSEEYLSELEFLATTDGFITKKWFIQKLNVPDIKYYIGKGKLDEIQVYLKENDIEHIIFDDDLSPSQLRNLEKELKCTIYDRSLLILEIFHNRAKTSQAKTQVELARYQYLLPRLTRMWTHLERQRGGTGTRGGAGEKEIETDRRNIRNQISVLQKRLEKIEKQSATQRKGRGNIVRVSIVGYTNAGKSTLMRLLSKSDVLAEDKLFATVDSTVRKVVFNQIPFLLSDTVGFIRKLPHHLIESFKSTLDEIREADILLHVIDVSHPFYENHKEVVEQTLNEIKVVDKSILQIYNKVDLPGEEEQQALVKKKGKDKVYISTTKKINIERLRELIFKEVKKKHITIYPNYLKKEVY